MSNKESNIEKTNFDAFIQAVGSEIEQAQVRLIVAANAQMLFHYWKVGNYILYHQQLHGWGSKIIKQLAKAIRLHYPEKKGYSERNLTYMCQFAKAYPLRALQSFIETDARLTPKYALLSTHAGRRTFICNALALGIPAQVVMKWTGHSDYKAMKPYIDIADDIKANAMNKFNQL